MGVPISWQTEQGAELAFGDGATFGRSITIVRGGVVIDDHLAETHVCRMAFARDSEGNAFVWHHRTNARRANESALKTRLTTA